MNNLVNRLRVTWDSDRSIMSQTDTWMKERREAADRIEKLERALELYEAERNRFKHTKPEITGAYYLAGGHGNKDQNMLPEYVEIVPAYGCAWSQIYQKTERTISMEGS